MSEHEIKEVLALMQARKALRQESLVQLLMWDGPSAFSAERSATIQGGWPDVMEALQLLGPKYEDADFRELTQ